MKPLTFRFRLPVNPPVRSLPSELRALRIEHGVTAELRESVVPGVLKVSLEADRSSTLQAAGKAFNDYLERAGATHAID